MAGYKNYKSNYPYKKWKSGLSKKSWGNFKAAKQTRDSMNFVIKCNVAFAASYYKANKTGVASINMYDVLRKNSQFKSFMALYDQVKINSIRCKLNVVDADTSMANYNSVKTINICTAWDRTGLSVDQVNFLSNVPVNYDSGINVIQNKDFDLTNVLSFINVIGPGVTEATGNEKTILNSFQRWTSSPYLFASSNAEKSAYVSTSSFGEAIKKHDARVGVYELSDSYTAGCVNDLLSSVNPCVPFENLSLPWKPTLLVGVFKTGINNGIVDQYMDCDPVTFNGEFTIDVTFRNLKAST